MSELKTKTIKGVIWGSLERFSGQGVQFLVLIVMARLLTPKDYGLVGMIAIFTNIAQTFVDSGFSQALIRKNDRTEVDNSTTFYFNVVVGISIYLLFYVISPYVAKFYNEPSLTSLMRTISLTVVFNSLAVVQIALFTVNVDFKTQAKSTFFSSLISGIIGIISAYYGMGAWALVYQQLSCTGLNALFLWILSRWRPKLLFSWNSFRVLFSFGSKILASGIINTIYNNLYQLVIGKFFSASILGFYTRAAHFAQFPSTNISGILQRVTYPVLCKVQDEKSRLVDIYRRFIRISTLIIFPLMMILAGLSYPIVNLVLGDKWMFSAKLLMILCFSLMWYPVHHLNVNILQAIGRSDLTLRTEIMKKALGVVVLVITIPFGITIMCYGSIVNSILSLMINCYYVGKLLDLGFIKQMRDVMPVFVVSIVVFVELFLLNFIINNSLLLIAIGTIIGIGTFIFLCILFNLKAYRDLLSLRKQS